MVSKKKLGIALGAGAGAAVLIYLATRGKEAPPVEPPPEPPPGLTNLYGVVHYEGTPIEGAKITLDGQIAYTDGQGEYFFGELTPGGYSIITEKEGFETVTDDIVLSEGNNEFSIELIPVGVPPPEGISFSIEVYNIPDYAAGSYQWYVTYVGKHGMVDPEGGIWTPIDSPILVENVPENGRTLQVTLMAGPYEVWNFTAIRTFRDGETYRFNLAAGILEGPGIALTNLTVTPDFIYEGQEPINVSVTASNTGDIAESHEVVFTLNNEVVETTVISLEPGQSEDLSINLTPVTGSYQIKVDGLSARFTVKPYYPPVSSPELVSVKWLPVYQWRNYGWPKFQGTIRLPAPGKDQIYKFRGDVGGANIGWNNFTFKSGNEWRFTGEAPMEYFPERLLCLVGYEEKVWYRCPVCGRIDNTDPLPPSEEQIINQYYSHCRHYCELSNNPEHPHCFPPPPEIWWEEEPKYQLSVIPCPGTTISLKLHIILIDPEQIGLYYGSWTINTGLTFTIRKTM